MSDYYIGKRENEGKCATLLSLMKMKMKESGENEKKGERKEMVNFNNLSYFGGYFRHLKLK